MYERVSQDQSHSDTFSFDLVSRSANDTNMYSDSATAPSGTAPKNGASHVFTTDVTDRAGRMSSPHEKSATRHATLKRSALQEWFSTSFDVLLSLFPLFFLVIAVLCLTLNGKQLSAYGERIKAITLISPTIFPIIYAAILGKALRRLGLFKAERGSTIGTLEQLMGSQSFFASIERQFGLRRINFLGITIISAWLLSPLGGQSSLRLLSTSSSTTVFDSTIKYHSMEGFKNDTLFSEEMDDDSWGQYATLYMTALQTSGQTFQEPQDLFGTIKIPDLASLDSTNKTSSDWRNVGEGKVAYTSLLGHPVADIPRIGNTTFSIESSYWEVRCSPFTPGNSFPMGNESSRDYLLIGPGNSGPSFELRSELGDKDLKNITTPSGRRVEFDFFYLSKSATSHAINSTCTASLRLVESEIGCQAAACAVRRVRDVNRDIPGWFWPMKSSSGDNWSRFIFLLTSFMPGADLGPRRNTKQKTWSSELVEQFILNPDLTKAVYSGQGTGNKFHWLNMTELSTDVFSQRLSVAMNTFWDSTIGLKYRIEKLTSKDIEVEAGDNSEKFWNTATATEERYDGEHYVCSIPFAIITIAISLFLFVAGNVAVVLGFITRVPDILGYVSSYARDDPYFSQHVPSHLDGMAATRALRDVRIRIGDVQKENEIGHVAFATMDIGPERVNKMRLYD